MGPIPTGKPHRGPEPRRVQVLELVGLGACSAPNPTGLNRFADALQQTQCGVEGVGAEQIGGAFAGGVDHCGVEVELGQACTAR
jgi:hypothetical protein